MPDRSLEARVKSLEYENQKLVELNRNLYGWRRRLELLLEFGNKAAAQNDLDRLLEFLMEGTKKIVEADRCTIFVLDSSSNELWSKAAQGLGDVIRFPIHRGLAGHVARMGEPIIIHDAYSDPRFNPEFDQGLNYKTKTLLAVPMRNVQGKITGVFQVLNKKIGVFDEQDSELLAMLANQASGAIENAQLSRELHSSTVETIFCLSLAAEYRDQDDTAAHLKRMSAYSAIMARKLGLSAEEAENIQLASAMHDVGKIGVPDAILLKPAKLTQEEYEIMKQHTIIGSKILGHSSSALVKLSREIAMSHHERFDGTGYPAGLKGEQIPLAGRIVALADVFDALTSKRVYKEAWDLEETLKTIQEQSGKHFDPRIVEAFLAGLDECKVVMDKYKALRQ